MLELVLVNGVRLRLSRAVRAAIEGTLLVCRDGRGRLVLALPASGAEVAECVLEPQLTELLHIP